MDRLPPQEQIPSLYRQLVSQESQLLQSRYRWPTGIYVLDGVGGPASADGLTDLKAYQFNKSLPAGVATPLLRIFVKPLSFGTTMRFLAIMNWTARRTDGTAAMRSRVEYFRFHYDGTVAASAGPGNTATVSTTPALNITIGLTNGYLSEQNQGLTLAANPNHPCSISGNLTVIGLR